MSSCENEGESKVYVDVNNAAANTIVIVELAKLS